MSRLKVNSQLVFLAVGCALFAYLLIRLHPSEVFALLREIGWYFGFVIAIYCCYELVRTWALERCLLEGERPSFWALVGIRISGEAIQFLTFTGPFLAEPAKATFLRNRGLPVSQAFGAEVSEFLIYTFTSSVMSVAGLSYLLHSYHLSHAVAIAARSILYAICGFLLVSAYAIIRRVYLIGAIVKRMCKLALLKRLNIDPAQVRRTEDVLFTVFRDRPLRLLAIVGIELVSQALLVLELFVLLWATGTFSRLDPFLIESCTKFISVGFFFIPGQIGVTAGAYAILSHELGLAATTGFALALARRLRSFLVSGAGLALTSRFYRRETPALRRNGSPSSQNKASASTSLPIK
ncbi:MAG TPA: lysylphosphatidylglycerol synthase domain-containing protein [Bryobacteraceae bacterium]|nr:lysylphosphatidylglycerol synthase domain-containing protein [Bryobacteraceae bacterium]